MRLGHVVRWALVAHDCLEQSVACSGGQNAYPTKGKPVSASDAPSTGDRRRRNRRSRPRQGGKQHESPTIGGRQEARKVVPEQMDKPAPKAVRPLRDHVLCTHAMKPAHNDGPFHMRPGLATIRPVPVDHIGDTILSCDCLHEGPHAWPDAYHQVTTSDLPGTDPASPSADSVDESEVGVE